MCCTRGLRDSVMTSMAAMPPSLMNCVWLSCDSARLPSAVTASVSHVASPLLAISNSGFSAPPSTILRPFSSCRLSSLAALAAYLAVSTLRLRSIFVTASRAPTLAASARRSKLDARLRRPRAATRWYSAMSRRADGTRAMSTKSWYALYLTSFTRSCGLLARLAMHSAAGSLRLAMLSWALAIMMGILSMAAILLLNSVASARRATARRHHFSTSTSSDLVMRAKRKRTMSSVSLAASLAAASGSSAILE
mmetsp:Transcript_19989/g.49629  ORF Transcript_19989/g.49629 Transcript_19989/m.49629 type:complete len:251 (-) Transcript_19989:765-1517(-)